MLSPRRLFSLMRKTVSAWSDDQAPGMGAAIAYYTVFSVAPLLLIVIAMAGLIFGRDAVQGEVVAQVQGLMGREGAVAIEGLLKSASEPKTSAFATLVGVVLLCLGATTVFAEIQNALDRIWQIPPTKKPGGVWGFLRTRLLSFGIVLGLGFLLLVSLVISAAVAALGSWWGNYFKGWEATLHIVNLVVSLTFSTLLFAMIYRAHATHTHCVERGVDRRGGHRSAVRDRQSLHRALSRQERSNVRLWRCGFLGRLAGVGVLLGADFPARRRIHSGARHRTPCADFSNGIESKRNTPRSPASRASSTARALRVRRLIPRAPAEPSRRGSGSRGLDPASDRGDDVRHGILMQDHFCAPLARQSAGFLHQRRLTRIGRQNLVVVVGVQVPLRLLLHYVVIPHRPTLPSSLSLYVFYVYARCGYRGLLLHPRGRKKSPLMRALVGTLGIGRESTLGRREADAQERISIAIVCHLLSVFV